MSERFFPDTMPQPLADTISLPWWEAAAEHRLVVQRCADCRQTRHPPAPVCPACRSHDADWQELPGRGEVYTYTVVHRPIAAGQELPAEFARPEVADAATSRQRRGVEQDSAGAIDGRRLARARVFHGGDPMSLGRERG